jgi:hypothetical protein
VGAASVRVGLGSAEGFGTGMCFGVIVDIGFGTGCGVASRIDTNAKEKIQAKTKKALFVLFVTAYNSFTVD